MLGPQIVYVALAVVRCSKAQGAFWASLVPSRTRAHNNGDYARRLGQLAISHCFIAHAIFAPVKWIVCIIMRYNWTLGVRCVFQFYNALCWIRSAADSFNAFSMHGVDYYVLICYAFCSYTQYFRMRFISRNCFNFIFVNEIFFR